MSELEVAAPVVPTHRDRTGLLIFFGVVQLLFGGICLLFVLVVSAVGTLHTTPTARPPQLLSTIVIYCGLAIYFFAAGVGSILRRRWAQPLTLAVNSLWLAIGVVAISISAYLLPRIFASPDTPDSSMILVVVFVVLFVLYILIPGVFTLVYRSPAVRATCFAADSRRRWTDGIPIPRLALALLFAFTALGLLPNLAYGAIPAFGIMLTGAVATAMVLSMSVLCAYLANQIYRGRPSAWWLMLLLQIIGMVTSILTLARTDLAKMSAQMGIPSQPQTDRMLALMHDPVLWTIAGAFWVALLAYMIWCRRYFVLQAPPSL